MVKPEKKEKEAILVDDSYLTQCGFEWLWPGRIPMGMLSLLAGHPGTGTSAITAFIAAQVSTGQPWPGAYYNQRELGSVIFVTGEEDLNAVKVRLQAAGADLHKVTILKASHLLSEGTQGQSWHFYHANWIGPLTRAIEAQGDTRLVIIDPITALMEGKTQNRGSIVKQCLYPLVRLAYERKVSIVVVRRTNKRYKKPALYYVTGSIEFVAIPRAVWLVTEDPEDADKWLFLPLKTNLTKEPPGLTFGLEGPVDRPRCCFEDGVIFKKADEVLSAQHKRYHYGIK